MTKKPRKQRRVSSRTKTDLKKPSFSERLKELWQDPEWRAARVADAKKQKNRGNRMGVPDGMRKAQAEPLWAQAREQAKRFIRLMEDADKVEREPVPGSEQEMAKRVLEEAYAMAVSPLTDSKVKASYQRLVLDFTKAKPESKSKLTLDKSEEWLAALEADMKKDGSPSDTSPSA